MRVSSLPKACYLEADRPRFEPATSWVASERSTVKLEFHDADTDTDTDILARIRADTSDTRDFLKLFLWQAEPTRRHSRDDPREDVDEDVGVGVVECQLYATAATQATSYR